MGSKWEVELWCVRSALGEEQWGWERVWGGNSLFGAVRAARRKRKETDCPVRITLR